MTYRFEIDEETEDNLPCYWIVKKAYIFKFHLYSEILGSDLHNEIPFYELIEAQEKLKQIIE